jgi:hypothetical protein
MAYYRREVPRDPGQLPDYLRQELERLQFELNNAQELLRVAKTNTTPDRPRTGDIRYADGTNWNPDAGAGVYVFNGTSWVRIGPGGTEWVDIDFPIIIRTTGTNIPTLATLQGNITAPQWQVNDFNVCEGQELVHGWSEGSRVYFHIHMITGGTNVDDRYVNWEVEYTWANIGDAVPTTTVVTSGDYKIEANTPALTHRIVSIANWVPTGGKIGAHVYARLKRIAAAGTAPTANPFCTMLQLHIECNTLGSTAISTK